MEVRQVLVSNRSKRRLLGFIASRGGRVTAGRNDSLLRWTLEILSNQAYTHERVGELKLVFEAVEADGDLVLERDERGKIFAARLTDDVDLRHADFERSMFDGPEELWSLVVTLLSANGRLRLKIDESEVESVLELAATADSRANALAEQLEEARAKIVDLTSQAVSPPTQQVADFEKELATANRALKTAQSRFDNQKTANDLKAESWKKEKQDLRRKLSQMGNEVARLRVQLDAANHTAEESISVNARLKAALKARNIIVQVMEDAGL